MSKLKTEHADIFATTYLKGNVLILNQFCKYLPIIDSRGKLGVKSVTEPNRTIGLYRTEATEISDSCGTGFYRCLRSELFGVIS